MASAYGIVHNYGEPKSTFDAQFAVQALNYKQQKYDANAIKIEQTLNQYGMQMSQLKNDAAKEYMYNKVNNLVNNIEGLRGADLGNNDVTKGILGHIGQALDDTVIKHIGYGQAIDRYNQTAQQYKEEGEGGYSDTNFQYGLAKAGYQDYVNGDVNAELGNLSYTPYVNVQQQYQDIFDENVAVKKGITTKVPTGDGYFVKKTVTGLDETEIRANVLSTLSPDQQKQLQINAWAASQGSVENAKQMYDAYTQPTIKKYQNDITRLKANYEGKTPAQKADIDAQVEARENSIKYITARRDNEDQLYSFLGAESMVTGLAQLYKPQVTSQEWTSDATALKNLEKQNSQIVSGLNLDQNNNKVTDVSTSSILTDYSDEDEVINIRNRAETEFKSNRDSLKSIYNQTYQSLPQNKKSEFDTAFNSYLEENGLEDSVDTRMDFLIQESNGGKGSYLTASDIVEAKALNREYKNQLKSRANGAAEILTQKQNEVVNDRFIRTLKENPNITITNENGEVVSASNYLRGVNSPDDLSESQRKTLLKSVFADATLSQTKNHSSGREGVNTLTNFNINNLANVNGELDKDLPMLVNPSDIIYSAFDRADFENDFEGLKRNMQLPPQMTKEQFSQSILPLLRSNVGTQGAGSNTMTLAQEIPLIGDAIRGVRGLAETVGTNFGRHLGFRNPAQNIIIGGEGTQTRRDLERALENETYDRFSFTDDSVEDDADLRSQLDYLDEFERDYGNYIAQDSKNFAQNKSITVESSGTREGEQVPAYEELISKGAAQGVQFERGNPITLIENEAGDAYIATQSDTRRKLTGDAEELLEDNRTAILYKRDLQGTNLMGWISEDKNARSINVDNTDELYSDPITFADKNTDERYLGDINRAFFGGQMTQRQLGFLTSQGAKDTLKQKHKKLLEDPEYGQMLNSLIDKSIDNSHIMRLKLEPTDFGVFNLKIGYEDNGEFKVIESRDTGASDITSTVGKFDVMQQKFYFDYLDDLFTDMERRGITSEADQINTLTKLFAK